MRHGTSSRRQRNRNNGGQRRSGGNGGRTQVYDSNGPDVRIRGTAHQVLEKYLALSKDAASAGDIVLSESYSQYAEHYQRIINSFEDNSGDNSQNTPVRKERSSFVKSGDNQDGEAAGNKGKAKAKEDLGLPASILGESPEAESEKTVEA